MSFGHSTRVTRHVPGVQYFSPGAIGPSKDRTEWGTNLVYLKLDVKLSIFVPMQCTCKAYYQISAHLQSIPVLSDQSGANLIIPPDMPSSGAAPRCKP